MFTKQERSHIVGIGESHRAQNVNADVFELCNPRPIIMGAFLLGKRMYLDLAERFANNRKSTNDFAVARMQICALSATICRYFNDKDVCIMRHGVRGEYQ